MSSDFNPYHAWLGLGQNVSKPNYYQLLGISADESDTTRIAAAADRTLTRARSVRPGPHAAAWSALLDEIRAAKRCLTQPASRAEYDRSLNGPAAAPASPAAASPVFRPAPRNAAPSGPLPGHGPLPMGPAPSSAPASYSAYTPTTPSTPAPSPTGYQAAPVASTQPGIQVTQPQAAAKSKRKNANAQRNGGSKASLWITIAAATLGCIIVGIGVGILVMVFRAGDNALSQHQGQTRSSGLGQIVPANSPTPEVIPTPAPPVPETVVPPVVPPQEIVEPVVSEDPGDTPEDPFATAEVVDSGPDNSGAMPSPPAEDVTDIPPGESSVSTPTPTEPPPATPPTTGPSADELRTLSVSMKSARAALAKFQFDEARTALAEAETIPMAAEHQAKYQRLQLLTLYASDFREALLKAIAGLHGGQEVVVGGKIPVAIVSASPQEIKIRHAGKMQSYTIDTLHPSLAVAIADQWLDQKNAATPLLKAAYIASAGRTDTDSRNKVKQWLEEAAKKGADVGTLDHVIDDTYDFTP